MSKFKVEETQSFDAEIVISKASDAKQLLNIEFPDDVDNILLLKNICAKLYQKIIELENKVAMIERRK